MSQLCAYSIPLRHDVEYPRRLQARITGTLLGTRYCGPNRNEEYTLDWDMDVQRATSSLDQCCLQHDYCVWDQGFCTTRHGLMFTPCECDKRLARCVGDEFGGFAGFAGKGLQWIVERVHGCIRAFNATHAHLVDSRGGPYRFARLETEQQV